MSTHTTHLDQLAAELALALTVGRVTTADGARFISRGRGDLDGVLLGFDLPAARAALHRMARRPMAPFRLVDIDGAVLEDGFPSAASAGAWAPNWGADHIEDAAGQRIGADGLVVGV